MPKGQTPKLKGSICNVPIDTNDVTIICIGTENNYHIYVNMCILIIRHCDLQFGGVGE